MAMTPRSDAAGTSGGAAPRRTTPTSGGVRRATMRDVADAAGVSQPLVSIVMRGAPGASTETRKHVLDVAASLGYRRDERARLLRQGRSKLIGVAFQAAQPFHGELLDELHLAATALGYSLALAAVTERRSEADAVEALLRDRVEGLILLGTATQTAQLERIAAEAPLVAVASQYDSAAFDTVCMDDALGTELAVEHLLARGHSRIAYLAAPGVSGDEVRRSAFERAMASAHGVVVDGGASEAGGAAAITVLLEAHPDVTAVLAFNDRCAVGAISQARLLGRRVPEDLAFVGFDDSAQAQLPYLQLTSLAQSPAELAANALQLAVASIERRGARSAGTIPGTGEGARSAAEHRILTPRLVIRSSSAPR